MMHPTAISNCKSFFDAYASSFSSQPKVKVIEIGSQDVNGTLRSTIPSSFEYVGVDFVEGKNVDVVLEDPYKLPFESESADIVLSSSCFEHSEMFWLVFLEIMRVLKPKGLFYLNVPSNGWFHRHPVDCWRFYPDSGRALVSWAKRNSINAALLESYTSLQAKDVERF
jgi:SAM-dependent methyltransferase